MEIFFQSSKYITKLITDFQNNKIDKLSLNQNILITTIFNYNYFKKKNNIYIEIKKGQNEIFQSFFIDEQKQEEKEKELLSKIRDRKSKKIVVEAIKDQRDSLIKDLSSKKNIKILQEHTYNSYITPKNISLSLNLELNKKHKKRKKFFDINENISYINPNYSDKKKIISSGFIEPPFIYEINELNFNDGIKDDKIKNDNENNNFESLINEEDEILFYDEKLRKNEKITSLTDWSNRLIDDDIINDFEELKQKKKRNKITKVDNLFFILKQENIIKKEMNTYLKSNNTILYNEISQKDHFKEFIGYLSEKSYKAYIKKMNYSFLILMLLSYFDFEKFSGDYEYLDESEAIIIFIKKILLFCGIVSNKVYDSLMHTVINNRGDLTFENYINFFLPIFDLPDRYQTYKYNFLLFLVKKSGFNTISMSNYKLFCDLIKGKAIYEEETCDDIIGKMIPIIKAKYPKDDFDNLNYQHVSIILEFLVNYEYRN